MANATPRWIAALSVLPLAVACAPEPEASEGPSPTQGHLALTVDVLADTDLAGFSFTATGVDCDTGAALAPPVVVQTTRDLEDLLIPGGNTAFEGRPFDAASGHLFADAFLWLAQGCYDVVAQPLTDSGAPSADCAPAARRAVPVHAGGTTEITLISQCRGAARGGLDVIATVNHAPEIGDVRYDPSKFTCEAETTVCLVASDPDGDPLAVKWIAEGAGIALASQTATPVEGGIELCATFSLSAPGSYTVAATVYDLARDAAGAEATIESLLQQQPEGGSSHAAIKLPVHAMDPSACVGLCLCPEGFVANAAGDGCEGVAQVPAIFAGEAATVCAGFQERSYGALGARLPGGTVVTDHPFFGGDGTIGAFGEPQDTRLIAAGVWQCNGDPEDPNWMLTQGLPEREWIGFTTCLTVPETGAYVVGIAGDNQVRLRVDGQVMYQSPTVHDQTNFFYWHLQPVQLTAGTHVLELAGWNEHGLASYAAEIYGPFPLEGVADDAALQTLDYGANVLWSTADQIGRSFDLGTSAGWRCEADGEVLSRCGGGEPVCERREVKACE